MLLAGTCSVYRRVLVPPIGFEPILHSSKGWGAAITPGRRVPAPGRGTSPHSATRRPAPRAARREGVGVVHPLDPVGDALSVGEALYVLLDGVAARLAGRGGVTLAGPVAVASYEAGYKLLEASRVALRPALLVLYPVSAALAALSAAPAAVPGRACRPSSAPRTRSTSSSPRTPSTSSTRRRSTGW